VSQWKWTPERTQGIWRYGAAWLKPFIAAAPWITVLVLLLMLHTVAGALYTSKGILFDLPDSSGLDEGERSSLVALVMPMPHKASARGDTLVFFDDSRYSMGDDSSVAAFAEHLSDRVAKTGRKTLLVLADRRIVAGDLMRIAALAKRSGATGVMFAEKRAGKAEE